jgi:hypothetical protein
MVVQVPDACHHPELSVELSVYLMFAGAVKKIIMLANDDRRHDGYNNKLNSNKCNEYNYNDDNKHNDDNEKKN